ncbi:hypothetical protein ACQEVS_30840 [Streptomyces sp. CA-181903]|uniref:hypothetical protein n=1 Tax=Streptomyces sp. CA-181903 TaxID=3240055 RepID=UPI003D8E8C81
MLTTALRRHGERTCRDRHCYWAGGATAGTLLGPVIPDGIKGLDFAVTALFTVLAIDAFRAHRDVPTPLLALACALVARFVFPGQLLLAGFSLFTAGLLARYHWVRRQRPCA